MNISFGIFCFGEDHYFRGTVDKINKILNHGYECYVLTDNPEYFEKRYTPTYLHIIPYFKKNPSYHDKMILPIYVLKKHNICILIDADCDILDERFLKDIRYYDFKKGITYIDTLSNHISKKEFVKDLNLNTNEWVHYNNYLQMMYPEYNNLQLMWEYFIVINKDGFNIDKFYKIYEKMQLTKDFNDLLHNKDVSGAGEGISIQVSAILSETQIQKDDDLYNILKDKIRSISKKYTPKQLWPNWMK